jgi:predicted transcriptional regulator
MSVKKMNVEGQGLTRFFGPLESRIMDVLWSSGPVSIREVQTVLNQETPITVNAVMTVMNRLLDKGHLTKESVGTGRARVAKFSTLQTKAQFLEEQTRTVSQGLIQEYGSLVVNHMIDALDDVEPEVIARLERKLNDMKRGKKP